MRMPCSLNNNSRHVPFSPRIPSSVLQDIPALYFHVFFQKTLSGLRKEHTSLVSSSSANTTALERANLQIEGLRDTVAESQEKLAASERKVKELNQQLEKWKKLESREDEELEKLRKRKVELEVEVQDLQGRLAESSQAAAQRDKLNTKLDKYKVSLEEHKVSTDTCFLFLVFLVMSRPLWTRGTGSSTREKTKSANLRSATQNWKPICRTFNERSRL